MTDKNLFEGFTTSTPFFLMCLLFFCLAGLSKLVLKESVIHVPSKQRTFWQRINFIKRVTELCSNKQLKVLLIVSTCFTLAVDIFFEFGPVYLTIKWTLGPANLSVYNAILCLGLVIGNGWLPAFVSKRVSNRLPVITAIGIFALCLFGIALVDSVLMMMMLFGFSGLVIGLAATLLTVRISDSVSDTIQGEVMGTQLSLRVLGDGIICLFGGALLILSSKLILIVAAVLSLVAMIYYRAKHHAVIGRG